MEQQSWSKMSLEERCDKVFADFESQRAETAASIQAEIDALRAKIADGRPNEELAEDVLALSQAIVKQAVHRDKTYRDYLGELEYELRHELRAQEAKHKEYENLVAQHEAVDAEWRRVSLEEDADDQEDWRSNYALCRDLGADI
jgi:hypothetical protein